ncbi:MAG TPA: AraC family transcriptional regulator, partial [Alcanivorax sp.]|nr:AraC family transcriptional regulator [Alcanivorax sp.]
MYHVSVLAYDGVFASALTGVMDLLNLTGVTWNRIHGQPLNRQFKVQMVSRGGEPVRCTAGMRIAVDTALERVDQCDLVVVPTIGNEITQVLQAERDTLEWLRFLHAGGADLA